MLVMRLSGGLGNQMWQYAFGRSFALERHTRLVLDVDDCASTPQNDYEGYSLAKAFGLRTEILTRRDRRLITVWRHVPGWRRTRFVAYNKVRPYEFSKEIGRHCYVSGTFQDLRYWEQHAPIIREDFAAIHDPPTDSLWLERIAATRSVAVHVRRGDYLAAGMLEVQDIAYYSRAMGHVQEVLGDKDLHFFVFTDDEAWVRQNFSGLHENIHVVGRLGLSSWAEMSLMSRCEHFIVANSSFSWWAAWLGQSAHSCVIYPYAWRKKQKLNDLLVESMPKGWIPASRDGLVMK